MPFWQSVLGYIPRPDSPEEDLVDSHERGVRIAQEPVDQD